MIDLTETPSPWLTLAVATISAVGIIVVAAITRLGRRENKEDHNTVQAQIQEMRAEAREDRSERRQNGAALRDIDQSLKAHRQELDGHIKDLHAPTNQQTPGG